MAIATAVFGAAAMLPGAAPRAQQPAPAQQAPAELPPVNVQGDQPERYNQSQPSLNRLPQRQVDVPQTMNVITKELMRDQAVTRVEDALRNIPGITINAGEGGAAGDNLTIRGFAARGDFFIDGLRDNGSYTRDSFNLDAIEVFKGPSAVLFGRGSTGGVVNLVTKAPRRENFIQGTAMLGTDSYYRATADVNQSFGESSAFRLNVMGESSEIASRDVAEDKRWGIAPSLGIGLGTPTELTLSYLHQEENNIPDYGVPYLFGKPAPVARSTFYGLGARDYEDTVVDIFTAKLKHRFNEQMDVTNTLRYQHTNRKAVHTAPRIAGSPTPSTPLTSIVVNRGSPVRDQEVDYLVNNTEFTAEFTTGTLGHRIVAGIEFSRETTEANTFAYTGVPTAPLIDPNAFPSLIGMAKNQTGDNSSSVDLFSVYAMYQLKFLKYFELIGGLRYDSSKADYTSTTYATGVTTDLSNNDDMLSPRGSVVFKPTDNQSYYISYGTSYNPSAEFLTLSTATADLKPEKNRTFEIGAKYDMFDGGLSLTGAIFRIDKTNGRTPATDGSGSQVLEGKQRVDGFEVGLAGRITRNWNIFAGYAYLDSKIKESNTAAEVGNEMPFAPKHSASIWTTYTVLDKFTIGGGAFYTGSQYANTANTNKVDDSIRVDAMAAYQVSSNVTLQLNVLNVFNEKYYSEIYTGHIVPGPGTAAILSAALRF